MTVGGSGWHRAGRSPDLAGAGFGEVSEDVADTELDQRGWAAVARQAVEVAELVEAVRTCPVLSKHRDRSIVILHVAHRRPPLRDARGAPRRTTGRHERRQSE